MLTGVGFNKLCPAIMTMIPAETAGNEYMMEFAGSTKSARERERPRCVMGGVKYLEVTDPSLELFILDARSTILFFETVPHRTRDPVCSALLMLIQATPDYEALWNAAKIEQGILETGLNTRSVVETAA